MTAFLLALIVFFAYAGCDSIKVVASTLGPIGTVIKNWNEGTGLMDSTLQCIDAYADLGPTGGNEHDNDSYIRVLPSTSLSKERKRYNVHILSIVGPN